MKRNAGCALALVLAACTPSPGVAPDASARAAASGETRSSAAPAREADVDGGAPAEKGAAIDAAAPRGARDLPGPDRLLAPFRGAKARGFVGVTRAMAEARDASDRVLVSLDGRTAVDATRPVLVASVTKLWTAVAALRMVERGELSLDATVAELLPELAARPWADSTLRELMTHTSRVPELAGDGYFRRADVDFSNPVAALAKWIPRGVTDIRGVYKYRNAEYALVGAALATKAGRTAAEVLAREVFEPAGMTSAGLLVGRPPDGLDLAPMGPVRPQTFFTAGAGYASAADLLAFFEALAGDRLLGEASKATLFAGAPERGYHAMGCWASSFKAADGRATLIVERPGSFGNIRVFTAFFPEAGRAVVAHTSDALDIAKPRAGSGIAPALARVALE